MHHDLPGVGKNLQDHLQIRTISEVKISKPLMIMPKPSAARFDWAGIFTQRSAPSMRASWAHL